MKTIAHHGYDSWKLAQEQVGITRDAAGKEFRSWYELTPAEREVWYQTTDAIAREVAEAHK